MTMKITFEGETLDAVMSSANNAVGEYIALAEAAHAAQGSPNPQANGESKDDIIIPADGDPVDHKIVRQQAISILTEVYSAAAKDKKDPKDEVNALLEKYSVDNLRDVKDENVTELFEDATRLSNIFGVTV